MIGTKVMIIMGSASDKEVAKKAIKQFEELGVGFDIHVASAHRTPEKIKLLIEQSEADIEVYITIAGLAAHLPGVVAAQTYRPVISVPVNASLGGLDSLLSSTQTNKTPTATVGIGRADNAAILATQLLTINHPELNTKIEDLREKLYNKVEKSEKEFLDELTSPQYRKLDIKLDNLHKINSNSGEEEDKIIILTDNNSSSQLGILSKTLMDMEINHELVHKEDIPDMYTWLEGNRTTSLYLVVTPYSGVLAGEVAALTTKPVLALALPKELYGLDSLLSLINMPPGIPIGVLGLNNPYDAGLFIGEVLGLRNNEIFENTEQMRG